MQRNYFENSGCLHDIPRRKKLFYSNTPKRMPKKQIKPFHAVYIIHKTTNKRYMHKVKTSLVFSSIILSPEEQFIQKQSSN